MEEKKEIDWKQELWEKRWKNNQLRWHKQEVNPFLIKYLKFEYEDASISVVPFFMKKSSSVKKIFIPLCGKTKDVAYILTLGFSVFAVEGVKQAIEALDEENSFNLVFNSKDSIYSTEDKKLMIYWGNFFTCPIEKWGPFDFIWDRGSLTAIDVTYRQLYKDVIRRSVFGTLSDGSFREFIYLLVTFNYDKSKSDGRGPKCIDEDDMKNLCEDWANFRLLESVPLSSSHVIRIMVGQESPCFENIYLITKKNL